MSKDLPQQPEPENLSQLLKEELVGIIIEQVRVNSELQRIIEELRLEIERLKVSRDLDSKTSSKPPSSDLLQKSEKKKPKIEQQKNTAKRKPGGQPGHVGKTRKGFDRVDRYEILRPQRCRSCGNTEFEIDPVQVKSQQVAQLVERPIEIVEYRRHSCQCQDCGAIETADWSRDIIPGQDLGVRLQGFLGWMGNYGHLPYEKQQEMLWELGQIEIGRGTLVATNQRVEQAIAPRVSQLSTWVKQQQPNVHVDETPWSVQGAKEWLWVVAHPQFCLFHAADTRSRAELETQLGTEYQGVLSSDDYSVYNGYPVAAQQKCLAHLRRHFLKLSQLPGQDNQGIGKAFVSLIDQAFQNYQQWQLSGDEVTDNDWVIQFKVSLQLTLKQWISKAGATARTLLRSLQDKSEQWWYFLDHPEVPPDNNLAERSLRLAVTKRKVSGGSRSRERFQHTANLLSVVQTCRRQGRSVIDFFVQALKAHLTDASSSPSLLPPSST